MSPELRIQNQEGRLDLVESVDGQGSLAADIHTTCLQVHITRQYSECPRASNGRATVHVREARKQIESGTTSVFNVRASREADSAASPGTYMSMIISLSSTLR